MKKKTEVLSKVIDEYEKTLAVLDEHPNLNDCERADILMETTEEYLRIRNLNT
jgi:hypothetical protein